MTEKAPVDMAAAEAIPLKCILCPKKPGFSDVSHLLTHIASKTHLSYRFRTEVQSDSDATARETLRNYEEWYEHYGIRTLLAGRMAAKDQKKPTGKRGRGSGGPIGNKTRVPQPSKSDMQGVKAEPEDHLVRHSALGQWPHGHSNLNASLHLHSARQDFSTDHDIFNTPTVRRSFQYSALESPDNLTQAKYERWPSASDTVTTESIIPSENATECDDDDNDTSKLKGVKWPGMGLFDSANEDQKRKRNQRKDDSVLKHMEKTSCSVEPTEFVWTGDGEFQFRRTRDIYDSPSIEGSPDRKFEEEEKTSRKRTRRAGGVTNSTQTRQTRQIRPTRSSARIARIKQTAKAKDASSAVNQDDDSEDGQPTGTSTHTHARGHDSTQSLVDSYDVFRDTLERTSDRTESSLEEPSFAIRRPALQPLNPNMSISSPTPRSLAQHYGLSLTDTEKSSFSSQVPTHGGQTYFQAQSSMGGGSINPLYIRTGSGFTSFAPFGYQNYGADTKAPAPSFPQPSNVNNNNLGSTLSYNSYTNSYTGHTINRAHDFDI